MKSIIKYIVLIFSILGAALLAFARQNGAPPPGMPVNPIGVIPWNSELLTGACLVFFGLFRLLKNRRN